MFAEDKIFRICTEVYKLYGGIDFDKIYEALPN